MFSGCTVPSNSKEIKLGGSNQEAFPSAGKNTGENLVPCCTWKCLPTAIPSGVDISEVTECHLLRQMNSQWMSLKLLQGLVSNKLTAYLPAFDIFLTQWIIAILSKGFKAENFESQNSLKLSFTNIWGLSSNFVDCDSFLELNSPNILGLCETNLNDSIDSGNFSVRDYLLLVRKDSTTHMHASAVYVKGKTSFCTVLISRKHWEFSCFGLAIVCRGFEPYPFL